MKIIKTIFTKEENSEMIFTKDDCELLILKWRNHPKECANSKYGEYMINLVIDLINSKVDK